MGKRIAKTNARTPWAKALALVGQCEARLIVSAHPFGKTCAVGTAAALEVTNRAFPNLHSFVSHTEIKRRFMAQVALEKPNP